MTQSNEIYLLNQHTQQLERFVKQESALEIKEKPNDNILYGKTIIECMNYFLELRETTVRPRSFDSYKDSARLLKEWLVVKNLSILN